MSAAPPTLVLASGTRFQDRYEILGELGAGSFGRVYRARQLSTGQDVAVKILRLNEGDATAEVENQRQRFLREMRLCAALSHPHIVRLIDSGVFGAGLLYAVFEHVPGTTLRQVLAEEGRLEQDEALRIMSQVLDAFACAHAQGVVHRDLKPENVMVTRTGLRRNATVLDFGLGGFSDGAFVRDARLTGTRELLGTPSYAAPEQLRGEPVSASADMYSWGLVFLECLTGDVVMAGRTAYDALMKQLGPEPAALPAWLREQRLGRLLAVVTAKEPAARDISEPALLEALESIQRAAIAPPVDGVAADGERRQMTVLACATTVARLDGAPVELDDLDHAVQAQHRLYDELAQESGQVLVRGDAGAVEIVFGYPKARENDARRAVRLAFRILATSRARAAVLARERGLSVAVRAGLHSGLGIVRVHGNGSKGETRTEIVGAPAGLATRLAERADHDEVLASADTWALLRDEFECERTDEVLAPDGERVRVFRVVRERPSAALETFARAEEMPLVGRSGELGHLLETWGRAEAGELGVVLLQGEAGIGKSRLLRELRRRVPGEGWIACRCTAEGGGTSLHPIVALLRSLPGSLERLLGDLGFDVDATWPLFAALLDVPAGPDYATLRLAPERQKELTLRAFAALVLRLARRRPLVFVVEDLHWADPTTNELIAVLLDEARAAYGTTEPGRGGLCLVFTARAEFAAPWTTDGVTLLPLGRLSRRDVAAMLNAGRATADEVSAAVVDRIVDRTDGVPLFVEELALVLRAEGESAAGTVAIPATLRELLAARLDALSASARESVQYAAALGREVRYPLLQAVVPKPAWELRQDVAELVDARLLFARRNAAEEGYVFKHALVRDAAYASMVRGTRQRVHHAIASALRDRVPELVEGQPEMLALHLEEGGELPAAAERWYQAGDRAFRRAAYAEAIAHCERSLAVVARMPQTPARIRQEIESLTVLGTVYLSTSGHSHPRGREVFARAQALCEAHGVELSLKIVAGLYGAYMMLGDRGALAAVRPLSERLLGSPDPVADLTALSTLGVHAFWAGEHVCARDMFARGMPLYESAAFRAYAETYGWDGGIYLPLYAIWNRAIMGDPGHDDAAVMAAAAASFDPQAPALVSLFAMATAHLRGDVAAARAHAEHVIALSSEQRFYGILPMGFCGHGLALASQGDVASGLAEIGQGIDILRAAGAWTVLGYYLTYLAEAHLIAGDVAAGLAGIAEARERCERELARVQEPELFRLEGELRALAGDDAAAERAFRRALALAESRGARAWGQRAAASLARFLRDRGRAA